MNEKKSKAVHWRQHVGDLANTYKAFIGTNYLSLAYGFKLAGLGFGVMGLIIVASLTNHCCKLIVKCKKKAVRQILQQHSFNLDNDEDDVEYALLKTRLTSNLSYTDLGRLTFGKRGVVIVNFCVIVTQLGFCIGYSIFVGNMLYQLISPPKDVPFPVSSPQYQHDFNGTVADFVMKKSLEDDYISLLGNTTSLPPSIDLNIPLPKVDTYNVSKSTNDFSTKRPGLDLALSSKTEVMRSDEGELSSSQTVAPNDNKFLAPIHGKSTDRTTSSPAVTEHSSTTLSLSNKKDFSSPSTPVNPGVIMSTTVIPFGSSKDFASTDYNSNYTENEMGPSFEKSSTSLLAKLVLATLPVFIVMTFFRNVRQLSAISILSNVSIFVGFFCVLGYIVLDFRVTDGIKLFNFATMPVYFVQIFGAYEAIGCILPIESSMDGNHHNFTMYLNVTVISYSCLMAVLATFSYLKYGENTQQIIAQNLPVDDVVVVVINVTLIIGVLLTYPLQIFPVVEILENMIFAEGRCCGPKKRVLMDEDGDVEVDEEWSSTQGLLDKPDNFTLPVASFVPKSVPAWKRNLFRTAVACFVVTIAVLLRNVFAYVGAIVGAVGSGPLLFIFPCLIHNKLSGSDISTAIYVKNICVMIFGVLCSVVGFIVSIIDVIDKV